ncbi:hypothetical protein [Paraburkholderia domus]|uniref:hypothetical protein n=1 Tax=Paraburkholderia domus TaxID=2793075 RepID=UPI001912A9B5|nr:hypothetical protein [Paraburkholderia domus]MBK5064866.1 hypothetical protein [Burkholderia sp. R-70199]CAE6967751.1 hypothetical protein R70199_07880 [Paraburkholderia domus]
MKESGKATVSLGETEVSVKREGSSKTSVARILGTFEKEGIVFVALDRLVHQPHEGSLGEWGVSGAISTILSRSSPQS